MSMEPIDTYLLAIGAEMTIVVMESLQLEPKYFDFANNHERQSETQYIELHVRRDNAKVILAVYHTYEEAQEAMSPEFKVITNH